MIVKQELVRKIKDHFDLNIYETKVWLALLSKGVVSAGEVAELSGVPRSRTYDVLESLAKRGFAVIKLGKPVKYIAMEPKTVVEKMKMQAQSDANDKVNLISNLRNTSEFTELEELHKTGISPVRAEDLSGHLKGRSNIMAKIREIFDNAQREVSICTTLEDFEDKSRVIMPALERLNKANIKVKIALNGDEEKIKKINNKFNLKIRKTENPGRFFIADKTETLFMINNNMENEVGVWLKSSFFSGTLGGMFDEHMKK
jgi:HTH-type transcriptional regulator, sugar sensing transcriptional regulator